MIAGGKKRIKIKKNLRLTTDQREREGGDGELTQKEKRSSGGGLVKFSSSGDSGEQQKKKEICWFGTGRGGDTIRFGGGVGFVQWSRRWEYSVDKVLRSSVDITV